MPRLPSGVKKKGRYIYTIDPAVETGFRVALGKLIPASRKVEEMMRTFTHWSAAEKDKPRYRYSAKGRTIEIAAKVPTDWVQVILFYLAENGLSREFDGEALLNIIQEWAEMKGVRLD